MDSTTTTVTVNYRRRKGKWKGKLIVIMSATGAGKSRLSIDPVTRYFHNSDKMQVYKGLNHTTNKITEQEQMGVPHHLLGAIDPTRPVFTPSDFRSSAYDYINDVCRRKIPIIVGGSNSFVYSLLDQDVFNGPDPDPVCSELRRSLDGRRLWETRDERKWGHDKFEEMSMHERPYNEGRRAPRGRNRGRGRGRGDNREFLHENRTKALDNNYQNGAPKSVRSRGPRRYRPVTKNNAEAPANNKRCNRGLQVAFRHNA